MCVRALSKVKHYNLSYRTLLCADDIQCKPSRELLRGTMPRTYMWAAVYRGESADEVLPLKLGDFETRCSTCGALYWRAEKLADGRDTPAWCCGKTLSYTLTESARLKPILDPAVEALYSGQSEDAIHFRRHGRAYNCILSVGMPSVQYDRRQVRTESVIGVNGRMAFNVPARPTVAQDGLPNQPGQLYFVDLSEEVVARRILCSTDAENLRPHIVQLLEGYLRSHNPLVQTMMLAKERLDAQRDAAISASESDVEGVVVLVNPHRDGFRVTDRYVVAHFCTCVMTGFSACHCARFSLCVTPFVSEDCLPKMGVRSARLGVT